MRERRGIGDDGVGRVVSRMGRVMRGELQSKVRK